MYAYYANAAFGLFPFRPFLSKPGLSTLYDAF